ncbi:MAG TPA: hypothetical protein VK806_08410 [Bacteroidia bacterium]|nr:hypothetical protein [Bacteroidia bacterium]
MLEKPYTTNEAQKISKGYNSLTFNPPVKLDTLNKFDSAHYKTGYWIQLLNKNGYPTDSISEGIFYFYVYYIKGGRFGKYSPYAYANLISPIHEYTLKLTDSSKQTPKTGITIMDGKYSHIRKGDIIEEDNYKNGKLLNTKYLGSKGRLTNDMDYTQKYKGIELSYRSATFAKNDSMTDCDYYYWQNKEEHIEHVMEGGRKINNAPPSELYRHDSLQIIDRWPFLLCKQNNIQLSYKDLWGIINISKDAQYELHKAKLNFYLSVVLDLSGIVCIVRGTNFPINSQDNSILEGSGFALMGIAIPFLLEYRKHIKKAAHIYNNSLRK